MAPLGHVPEPYQQMAPNRHVPEQYQQVAPQFPQSQPAACKEQIPTYAEFSERVSQLPPIQKLQPAPRIPKDQNDNWDCLFGFPGDISKKDKRKGGARLLSGNMFAWKNIVNSESELRD